MTRQIALLSITLTVFNLACCQQSAKSTLPEKSVGAECEDCKAVMEFGSASLNPVDTLPDFNEQGPKLEITGTIYKKDGKTPAEGVILYIYHTDQNGEYSTRGNDGSGTRRHGYIRGWIKTGADGRYAFYTLVPGAYPGRNNPAHIHPVIKEPGFAPYWIDEYLFDDDPILGQKERVSQQQRGGGGILKTRKRPDGILTAQRDIILGMNIPSYD